MMGQRRRGVIIRALDGVGWSNDVPFGASHRSVRPLRGHLGLQTPSPFADRERHDDVQAAAYEANDVDRVPRRNTRIAELVKCDVIDGLTLCIGRNRSRPLRQPVAAGHSALHTGNDPDHPQQASRSVGAVSPSRSRHRLRLTLFAGSPSCRSRRRRTSARTGFLSEPARRGPVGVDARDDEPFAEHAKTARQITREPVPDIDADPDKDPSRTAGIHAHRSRGDLNCISRTRSPSRRTPLCGFFKRAVAPTTIRPPSGRTVFTQTWQYQ
jgi:hypothetical protein